MVEVIDIGRADSLRWLEHLEDVYCDRWTHCIEKRHVLGNELFDNSVHC
jgi:hypothetical protein